MEDYIYFSSRGKAPWHELSNFASVPLTLTPALVLASPILSLVQPRLLGFVSEKEEVIFPSTEHIWQALKARDSATFFAFTVHGTFGSWNPNVFALTVARKIPPKAKKGKKKSITLEEFVISKMNQWRTRGNKNNIGIQAKLAANPTYAKPLGLSESQMAYDREHLDAATEQNVWLAILRLKFQVPHFKELLLSTGNAVLVEFDKGATRRHVHWGGMAVEGAVVGDNAMGKYLMQVRSELLSQ
jgi:predicted NAD-dependent protein-ADP-ribosyltransferase YbiA (DUF1768 family)